MNVGWWLRGWRWGGGKSLVTRWWQWGSSSNQNVPQWTAYMSSGGLKHKYSSGSKRGKRTTIKEDSESIGSTAYCTRTHQAFLHPGQSRTVGSHGSNVCTEIHTPTTQVRRDNRSPNLPCNVESDFSNTITNTKSYCTHNNYCTDFTSTIPLKASEVNLSYGTTPAIFSTTQTSDNQFSSIHSLKFLNPLQNQCRLSKINSLHPQLDHRYPLSNLTYPSSYVMQFLNHTAHNKSCIRSPDSHRSLQLQGLHLQTSRCQAQFSDLPTQPRGCHTQPPSHSAQPPGNSRPPSFTSSTTVAQRIVNKFPVPLRAYLQLMRLHQPIGSWLLFWPCGWSLALAMPPGCFPDPTLLALFGTGAVIMRGAGCTINDMWDRNIDGKVSRTATRPLADGTLTLWDATSLLALQLGLGCFILLQLNFTSIILGASSLGLVVVYPLMKRITWFPQVVLGFTFNWGALLGWTAVTSTIAAPPFLLYASGVAWTLLYDTIYAHQDKEDDAQLGIKSTALKFGNRTQPILGAIGVGMMSSLLAVGVYTDLAWPYYATLIAISTHIFRQIWTLKIDDPSDCGQKFRSNRHVGLMIFLGIIGGTVLKGEQT